MQKRSDKRGFSVSNQKVALEIDFSGAIGGFTEITILPNRPDLRTVHLHLRQCEITAVKVGGHVADFVHYDPLANVTISKPEDFHTYPELKRKLYSAFSEGEEGELSIAIPSQVSVVKQAEPAAPSTSKPPPPEYNTILIRIEYHCHNPVDGLRFILPSDAYPFRVPHVFTTPSSGDSARCWVPCVDSLWERCTWEFEFVVPRSLDADGDSPTGPNYPCVVVCSGEFLQQVVHPEEPDKVIFLFEQLVLTSAQNVAFAAGPFHVMPLVTKAETAAANAQSRSVPQLHAFCLPGHEAHLKATVSFLPQALRHYCQELGSYPFGSYKVVFVDELPVTRHDGATMCLASIDLLHPEDAIDPVFETRLSLSHGAATQWVGINIYQKTWSDGWLIHGLSSYVSGLFIQKLMGKNEYRFRLKKDMMRVADMDVGNYPPICQPGLLEPPDESVKQFIYLKSPLILHILDRRMHKTGTSQGLHRIIPKLVLDALQNESNAALSTHAFLRMCRKTASIDFRPFAEQWIYGSGCPRFAVKSHFNRKKMAVEMHVTQTSPAFAHNVNDPIALSTLRPVQFFDGQMTIRIHEADGTPYEHVLDIRQAVKKYDVPFNTKYKRVRRNTKRFIARQQAAEQAINPESAELIGVIDMSFGLGIWEDETSREDWKVADWSEAEESLMATATYEWIRLDTDLEWITMIQFDQEPFMWVSQLQRDRDVMAQLEAVHALARIPSKVVSTMLTKTVLTTHYFYRIRTEAALSLVSCAGPSSEYLGFFHLYKLFVRYCYPVQNKTDLFKNELMPKPNDFSDLPEYFVRKALITALSQIRIETGETLPIVRRFLINQLKFNDNSSNAYSDAYYIAHIIGALGCALVSTTPPERGLLQGSETISPQDSARAKVDRPLLEDALKEVDRYMDMDRVIPSLRNVVTVAALEFNSMIMMANMIPNDLMLFLTYTREGNAAPVRIAAFDGVFLQKWWTLEITRYLLAVISRDSSRTVAQHVASCMGESLAIQFTIGEIKVPSKELAPILVEEDATKPEKEQKPKKSEVDLMIKTLRKDADIGRNPVLRERLMPMMLNPRLDQDVRWSLLKLADLTFRAVEEAVPRLAIRLAVPAPAPTPDAPTKKVKLSLNLGGLGSSSAPPPRLVSAATPSALDSRKGSIVEPATPSAVPKLVLKPPKSQVAPAPAPAPVPTPKPTKPVPSWARSGLVFAEKKVIEALLKRLQLSEASKWFMVPVDPDRHNAPNYFDVIERPMDFLTITNNLKNGAYGSKEDLAADVRLMCNNAYKYNQVPEAPAYQAAKEIEGLLEELLRKTYSASEKSKKPLKVKPPQPPPPVLPSPSPAPAPATPAPATPAPATPAPATPAVDISVDVDDEILQAAEVPRPEPTLMEDDLDDVDEMLLSATAPAQSKRDDEDADGDIDDDLDAVLYDAADTSKAPPRRAPSVASSIEPPKAKLKVSFNQRTKPKAQTPPAPSPPYVPPVAGPSHTVPTKRRRESDSPPPQFKASVEHAAIHIPMDSIAGNRCKALLEYLITRIDYGWIFSKPVDSSQPGLENYYNEIAHPMDYSTMKKKIERGRYATMQDFADDLTLVYGNARKFNALAPDILSLVDKVESAWLSQWPKTVQGNKVASGPPSRTASRPVAMDSTTKAAALKALSGLKDADRAGIFHWPVDPVALNIPHYWDVIHKKNARDLSTIKGKIEKKAYSSFQDLDADVRLMFGNASKFNGKASEIGKYTSDLERIWEDILRARTAENNRTQKKPRLA